MLNFRQVSKYTKHVFTVKRVSTAPKTYVDVSVDQDNIAVLTIQKPKVNVLCPDLLHQMAEALDNIEKNKHKGVVITSALPSMFSAGLDLNVIYKPDLQRLSALMTNLNEVASKLLLSNCVSTSAINGHTSAGACILAVSTEYRVMMDGDFTISFNDTAVGIPVGQWIVDAFMNVMGRRNAELALTSSQMFYPQEALKAGLVNEIASDKEEAIEKCKKFIKKFDHIPSEARLATKKIFKSKVIESLAQLQSSR